MIQDYKFDPSLDRRPRERGRIRLLIASIALLGIVIGLLRLTAPPEPGLLASTLPSETEALATPPAMPTPPPKAQIVSSPLSLPGQTSEPSAALTTRTSSPADMPAVESQLASLPLPQQTQPSLLSPPPTLSETPNKDLATAPEIVVPQQTPAATTSEPIAQMRASWFTHTISSGDSLAKIFQQHSLSANLLHRVVHSSETAKSLAKIRPGQKLRFLLDDENNLQELVLVRSPVESLRIQAIDDDFKAERVVKDVKKRIASASGTIQSSLFLDGQKSGLSDAQIMELAALFGWDVDFALEIRAGDQFRLLYEEQYLDGEKYRDGPILAAEFINKGTPYQAFRFEDQNGKAAYYDAEGRNKRRAFIRTPIKFARISSRFTPKRWHPVLKKWRSHKGVDYAAPTGTPIKATGSGKVVFRGWKSGYGRVVIVQHANKYQTVYAHMSKFSSRAKSGSKVKQGQIIGYVGKSGLATGPHLHYEFRVNGVHRNPLTVKLPKSLPLPKSRLTLFKKQTAPLVAQLEAIEQRTMVASNKP